jgi:hypothetical protein
MLRFVDFYGKEINKIEIVSIKYSAVNILNVPILTLSIQTAISPR